MSVADPDEVQRLTWRVQALERENAILHDELDRRDALILQLRTHLELGQRNMNEAQKAVDAYSTAPPPLASVV